LAIDPETEETWAAIGHELLHFDKDGNRRAAYLLSTKQGTRIEAAALLVEHDRILIADDPNGIFDFALPEPRRQIPK
jgi:ABC-type lipoprotein export system ATPase subunit